jgi:hypothetical protein
VDTKQAEIDRLNEQVSKLRRAALAVILEYGRFSRVREATINALNDALRQDTAGK